MKTFSNTKLKFLEKTLCNILKSQSMTLLSELNLMKIHNLFLLLFGQIGKCNDNRNV